MCLTLRHSTPLCSVVSFVVHARFPSIYTHSFCFDSVPQASPSFMLWKVWKTRRSRLLSGLLCLHPCCSSSTEAGWFVSSLSDSLGLAHATSLPFTSHQGPSSSNSLHCDHIPYRSLPPPPCLLMSRSFCLTLLLSSSSGERLRHPAMRKLSAMSISILANPDFQT